MAKLVVLSEGFTGLTCELKADKTTVGRLEDNAFQIPEPSVSSHHCELTRRGVDLLVKDLNSTNGTFINGEKVVEAVLTAGGHPAPPIRSVRPAGLSEREVEVLRLVIRGLSNRQMAEALFVSPKTVDHHIQHIYDKIGVSTRVGATLFALQHGLVEGDH